MTRLPRPFCLIGLLLIFGSGCCCVQGVPQGNGYGMRGPDRCDGCTSGSSSPGIGEFASCRGGCGEVYVGEWLSEPPTPDPCDFPCGGCGKCNECQPIRNILRALWGTPYRNDCTAAWCGPSCDGGCDSAGGSDAFGGPIIHDGHHHHSSNCNCDHAAAAHGVSGPYRVPSHGISPEPMDGSSGPSQEAVPTPAPAVDSSVEPTSATRLNPAARKRAVRTASANR